LQPWGLLLGEDVETTPRKPPRIALPKLKPKAKTLKV
jgi:hypothetical protein